MSYLSPVGDAIATSMRVHTTVGHKTRPEFTEVSTRVPEVSPDEYHGLSAGAGAVVRT